MFGNRHCHAGDIDFLERIFSKQRQIHVTGNRHHWHRIHISGRNTGHEIRSPRTARCHTDADLARSSRITVRCMRRALLMRSKNVGYLIAVLIQSIIYIQNRSAGIPEDGINSLLFQTFYNNFRTCQ